MQCGDVDSSHCSLLIGCLCWFCLYPFNVDMKSSLVLQHNPTSQLPPRLWSITECIGHAVQVSADRVKPPLIKKVKGSLLVRISGCRLEYVAAVNNVNNGTKGLGVRWTELDKGRPLTRAGRYDSREMDRAGWDWRRPFHTVYDLTVNDRSNMHNSKFPDPRFRDGPEHQGEVMLLARALFVRLNSYYVFTSHFRLSDAFSPRCTPSRSSRSFKPGAVCYGTEKTAIIILLPVRRQYSTILCYGTISLFYVGNWESPVAKFTGNLPHDRYLAMQINPVAWRLWVLFACRISVY